MIKLKLLTSDKEYKTTGDTIYDALEKLPLSWENIKAKGVITVRDGKKSYEHLIYLKPLKRVFANKSAMMLLSKRLQLFLQ